MVDFILRVKQIIQLQIKNAGKSSLPDCSLQDEIPDGAAFDGLDIVIRSGPLLSAVIHQQGQGVLVVLRLKLGIGFDFGSVGQVLAIGGQGNPLSVFGVICSFGKHQSCLCAQPW